jgi:pimeloyl-ACP methyl ester carboxylesterase
LYQIIPMKHLFYFLLLPMLAASCIKGKPDFVYSRRPIVFVHGFLASGDTYEKQAKRFMSNDYPADRLFAFDWNSLGAANNEVLLDKFIDSIRILTGFETIDLVGHSAGSGLVYSYSAASLTRAKKIEHLVLLAGTAQTQPGGPNGEVETMNIYSTADLIATGGADIPDAINVRQTDKDHYEVATSVETFENMFAFFNTWQDPATTEVVPDATIVLAGKAASFGENVPRAGTQVQIYALDAATGFRVNASPDATFTTNVLGNWGPFTATADTYYEFVVSNPGVPNDRTVHYYREPFTRSDHLVYLRTFPTGASIAALFLASLPKDDDQAVVAFFGASQAAVAGRDALSINGNILSTNTFCDAANTTIALFAYDANNNSTTNMTQIAAFSLLPFLNGADIFFPTVSPQSITFEFNGRTQKVRNWKSKTEGVSVAVFE